MLNCLFIIPAAGKGSRLGLSTPKLLLPLSEKICVADRILEAAPVDSRVIIITSPWSEEEVQAFLRKRNDEYSERRKISTIIQTEPRGMGDAIFLSSSEIDNADTVIVSWGDQALINPRSVIKLKKAVEYYAFNKVSAFAVLITRCENPYVQFKLSDDMRQLLEILQTREGALTEQFGYSDCGLFAFTANNLVREWRKYLNFAEKGVITNEINFLPFLTYLCSADDRWEFVSVIAESELERVGINTMEDYKYVRQNIQRL